MTIIASVYAEVVELVDTLDLGSSASRRESSSLSFRTIWGIAKLVRQRVLIPPFIGSSPVTPAIFLKNRSNERFFIEQKVKGYVAQLVRAHHS